MIQDVTENLCHIALSVSGFRKTRTTIKKAHPQIFDGLSGDATYFFLKLLRVFSIWLRSKS